MQFEQLHTPARPRSYQKRMQSTRFRSARFANAIWWLKRSSTSGWNGAKQCGRSEQKKWWKSQCRWALYTIHKLLIGSSKFACWAIIVDGFGLITATAEVQGEPCPGHDLNDNLGAHCWVAPWRPPPGHPYQVHLAEPRETRSVVPQAFATQELLRTLKWSYYMNDM